MSKTETTVTETAITETTGAEVIAESAANAKLVPLLDKEKLKSIRTALGGERTFYESKDGRTAFELTNAAVEAAAGKTIDPESGLPFYGLPLVVREGDDAAPITEATRICVATVGVRDKATSTNGFKAIVAFAAPSVADFLESSNEAAKAFIAKLIEREATDVAFSTLRNPDMTLSDLQAAVAGVPATVDDIVTTSRESGGLDTDAFDTLWRPFREGVLKEKAPKIAANLPGKPEVLKAIRSKSYALANAQTRAFEENDIFVKLAKMMIQLGKHFTDKDGKPTPVDVSAIQEYLDERDSLNLAYNVPNLAADDFKLDF